MTVHITLMGGLANQCFQWAAALAVVGPGNEDQIQADPSWLEAYQNTPGITPRPFQLRALGVRPGARQVPCDEFYQESVPANYDPAKNYRLEGYFQDLRYWTPDVREWFRQRIPWRPRSTAKRGCIHVRRGDYVTNPSATSWHGVMPAEYYIRHTKNLHQSKGINRFVIYSDDYEWCQYTLVPRMWNEISQGLSLVVVENRDPWIDLSYMMKFDYHIIGNSTFGWLGAYLSNTTQGVIYPTNWLTDNKPRPPIFPATWWPSLPCDRNQTQP